MAQKLIYLDAGAFIARHRESDDYHAAAIYGWRQLEHQKIRCITSNLVLVEAVRYLTRSIGNGATAERLKIWLSSDWMRVLRPDTEIDLEAIALFEKYADQRIGFTDCVSFVLMRRHRIDVVFGFDDHFKRAGFHLWPGKRKH